MELILFSGLQGAGKSTFYQTHFANTHIRVNLDMLRTRNKERVLISACLGMQHPFVVDNTNMTIEERQVYISWVKVFKYRVMGYYFDVPLEECVRRNGLRDKPIPPVALRSASRRLQPPTLAEGYDALFRVDATGGALPLDFL